VLNSLYEQYKDQAAFFLVYIREAHPVSAWQMAINVQENVVFNDPKTFEERTTVAESCVRKLGIRIPALVDNLGDGVEAAYTGWPDRLYVIDRAGRVAYKSTPGPYGFTPKAIEESLRRAIAEN
jgi:Iodothyronine deiodinase